MVNDLKQLAIMAIALAPLISVSGVVMAAPVPVWTGPGPKACMGRCSMDWAMAQLSPARQAAVAEAMAADALGYSIPVTNGATFEMMSYFDEQPHADMRHTVAALNAVEPATGWQFDGWAFVKIAGCQNWAVLVDAPPVMAASGAPAQPTAPATPAAAAGATPSSVTPLGPLGFASGIDLAALTSVASSMTGSSDPEEEISSDAQEEMMQEIETLLDFAEADDDPSGPTDPVNPALLTDPPGPSLLTAPPDPGPAVVPLPASLSFAMLSLLALALWRKTFGARRIVG